MPTITCRVPFTRTRIRPTRGLRLRRNQGVSVPGRVPCARFGSNQCSARSPEKLLSAKAQVDELRRKPRGPQSPSRLLKTTDWASNRRTSRRETLIGPDSSARRLRIAVGDHLDPLSGTFGPCGKVRRQARCLDSQVGDYLLHLQGPGQLLLDEIWPGILVAK